MEMQSADSIFIFNFLEKVTYRNLIQSFVCLFVIFLHVRQREEEKRQAAEKEGRKQGRVIIYRLL